MGDSGLKSARALGSMRHSACSPRKNYGINDLCIRWNGEFPLNVKRLHTKQEDAAVRIDLHDERRKLRSKYLDRNSSDERISGSEIFEPISGLQFKFLRDSIIESTVNDKVHTSRAVTAKDAVLKKAEQKRSSSVGSSKYRFQMMWNTKGNYLEDGDFVKGKGHRIDTGPLSRPASGWSNRESRNAVELASECKGESALEKYYSLDIDTGKVSTRKLGSGANVIIGVNGKERQASRIAEEVDSDDDDEVEDGYPSRICSPRHIPLSWEDQLAQPMAKVVQPRTPASDTATSKVPDTKPVVFRRDRGLQRPVFPTKITKLQILGKENTSPFGFKRGPRRSSEQKSELTETMADAFQSPFIGRNVSDLTEYYLSKQEHGDPSGSSKIPKHQCRVTWGSATSIERIKQPLPFNRNTGRNGIASAGMIVVGTSTESLQALQKEKSISYEALQKNSSSLHRNTQDSGMLDQRERSLINIVQKLEIKSNTSEEDSSSSGTGKTSDTLDQRNRPRVRLKYSVSNPRAATAVKRSRSEGVFRGPAMSRSASAQRRTGGVVGEGSLLDLGAMRINPNRILSDVRLPTDQTGAKAQTSQGANDCNTGKVEPEDAKVDDLLKPIDAGLLSVDRRQPQSENKALQLQVTGCEEIGRIESPDFPVSWSTPPPSPAVTPKAKIQPVSDDDGAQPKFLSFGRHLSPKGGDVRGVLCIPTADENPPRDDSLYSPMVTGSSEEIFRRDQDSVAGPDFASNDENAAIDETNQTPFDESVDTKSNEDSPHGEEN